MKKTCNNPPVVDAVSSREGVRLGRRGFLAAGLSTAITAPFAVNYVETSPAPEQKRTPIFWGWEYAYVYAF